MHTKQLLYLGDDSLRSPLPQLDAHLIWISLLHLACQQFFGLLPVLMVSTEVMDSSCWLLDPRSDRAVV
jgi:hypothetical protein